MAMKYCTKLETAKEEMPYCFPRSSIKFQGHTGQNITDFNPNWAVPDYRPVAAFKSLRFALFFCDTTSSCAGLLPSSVYHVPCLAIKVYRFVHNLDLTYVNTLRPKRNGRYCVHVIFNVFLYEYAGILIKISFIFVEWSIDNIDKFFWLSIISNHLC